ncbi:hypothetical protein RCL1_005881 [Eukaryota sp. TZLM3-RCL]
MTSSPPSNVNVAVRIRPPFPDETKDPSYKSVVNAFNHLPSGLFSSVSVNVTSYERKDFSYDYVFDPSASQTDVYNVVAEPVIEGVINGMNGAIIGQTGTGKTYTLGILDSLRTTNSKDAGIIPRSLSRLYSLIEAKRKSREVSKYSIRLSFLQVYLDTVQDLSNPCSGNLVIREHPEKGLYVDNLKEMECNTYNSAIEFINHGLSNRVIAPTLLNFTSSRAHTVLTVDARLLVTKGDLSVKRSARLAFIDLAGSERIKKSLSSKNQMDSYAKRLQESRAINTSLAALGNVISILSSESDPSTASKTAPHIPYRDSKLTRILQPIFSGHCRVAMICTVSQSKASSGESLSTLLFAERCAGVRIKPQFNEVITSDDPVVIIQQLTNELKKLKKENEILKEVEEKRRNENVPIVSTSSNLPSLAPSSSSSSSSFDDSITKNSLLPVLNEVYSALCSHVSEIQVRSLIRREVEERSMYEELEAEFSRSQELQDLSANDGIESNLPTEPTHTSIEIPSILAQKFPMPKPIPVNNSESQIITEDILNGRMEINSKSTEHIQFSLMNLISSLSTLANSSEDLLLEYRAEIVNLLKQKQVLEAEQENWTELLQTLLLKNGEQRAQIARQCIIVEKTATENHLLRQNLEKLLPNFDISNSNSSNILPKNPAFLDPLKLVSTVNQVIKIQRRWRAKRLRKIEQLSSRHVPSKALSRNISQVRKHTETPPLPTRSTLKQAPLASPAPLSTTGPLHKMTTEIVNVFNYLLDYLVPPSAGSSTPSHSRASSRGLESVSLAVSSAPSFSSWHETCSSSASSFSIFDKRRQNLALSCISLSPHINIPPRRNLKVVTNKLVASVDFSDSDSDDDNFEQISLI